MDKPTTAACFLQMMLSWAMTIPALLKCKAHQKAAASDLGLKNQASSALATIPSLRMSTGSAQ